MSPPIRIRLSRYSFFVWVEMKEKWGTFTFPIRPERGQSHFFHELDLHVKQIPPGATYKRGPPRLFKLPLVNHLLHKLPGSDLARFP